MTIKIPEGCEIKEEIMRQFKAADEAYMANIDNHTIKTASKEDLDKYFEKFAETYYNIDQLDAIRYTMMDSLGHVSKCCSKPDKYKNIISKTMKFWSCRNCGKDLGDII